LSKAGTTLTHRFRYLLDWRMDDTTIPLFQLGPGDPTPADLAGLQLAPYPPGRVKFPPAGPTTAPRNRTGQNEQDLWSSYDTQAIRQITVYPWYQYPAYYGLPVTRRKRISISRPRLKSGKQVILRESMGREKIAGCRQHRTWEYHSPVTTTQAYRLAARQTGRFIIWG
jgi:hypothetical protein